jgi:hypothetical protein
MSRSYTSSSPWLLREGSGTTLIQFICSLIQLYSYLKKIKLSHYTPRRRLEGEEAKFLLIIDLSTRWDEWSASRPGRALASGKGPPVPIEQKVEWAPEPVRT